MSNQIGDENETNRGFFGIIISSEILNNSELSLCEKVVYGYIASYRKYCLDSNGKIANRLNISVRSVIRSIIKLQRADFIFVEKINGNNSKRRIYAVFGKPQKLSVLRSKDNLAKSFPRFPHSSQIGSSQIGATSCQFGTTPNRGASCQIGIQRIKNKKKKGEEPDF